MKQRRTDKEIVQKRALETREKLLKSALKLYTEKGYHSTTVDEIAKNAGLSTGVAYRYFKNKKDMLLAAITYGFSVIKELAGIEEADFFKTDLENTITAFERIHTEYYAFHEELEGLRHSDSDVGKLYDEFTKTAIQNVYDSVGTKDTLPAITLWFSDFINGLIAHWYIPVILIAGIVSGIIFYIRTPKGKYKYHYFKYTMPIFGRLIYSLDFMRFIKAMLLNLNNGMRIQDALEVSKNVVNNYVFLSIVETAINNILIGRSWIEPFEKSGLSTSMETEMLKIGMQTDLSEMMAKLVDYMEIDINNTLDKIMKVLPEVSYSIVGVVLIFFVLVILVPMIQVYMGTFLFSAAGV